MTESFRIIHIIGYLANQIISLSELCAIKHSDVQLDKGEIKIYGKAAKESFVQIANPDVLKALCRYQKVYRDIIAQAGTFFVSKLCRSLSD